MDTTKAKKIIEFSTENGGARSVVRDGLKSQVKAKILNVCELTGVHFTENEKTKELVMVLGEDKLTGKNVIARLTLVVALETEPTAKKAKTTVAVEVPTLDFD